MANINKIETARTQINEVSIEKWLQIFEALTRDDDYMEFGQINNLIIIFALLEIDIDVREGSMARNFLNEAEFNGIAADILKALATQEINWFKRLTGQRSLADSPEDPRS